MIVYLIKSTACLLLLYLVYRIFLECEKMLRFNRYFLLFSLVFGLTIPLITIEAGGQKLAKAQLTQQVNHLLQQPDQAYSGPNVKQTNPDQNINNEQRQSIPKEKQANTSSLPLIPILLVAYSIVTLALLTRFFRHLHSLFSKVAENEHQPYKNATLVLVNSGKTPHSFYKYIFVDKDLFESGRLDTAILQHEFRHVTDRHSLDILFIEILKVFFWFNPVLYFFKKAIQLNHEFLADESVIKKSHDILPYQKLLLNIKTDSDTPRLASSINYSITKKRLVMMTKKTSRFRNAAKKLALIPLMAGLVFVFSNKNANAQDVKSTSSSEMITALSSKVDTTRYMQIVEKYSEQIHAYLNITPSPQNRAKLNETYKEIPELYKKGMSIYDKLKKGNEDIRPIMPPPMKPESRMQVFYRQHPESVQKDTAILNRVANQYAHFLQKYSEISPVSEGNLKYIYKKLTIYYNNWHKIFEDTEGIAELAPLPTTPKEKIEAYSKKDSGN